METVVCTKTEIIERVREAEDQLRALGVKRLALFGSFVRGEPHSQSDIDLLVEFKSGQKTFDHFMALSFLLEALLQRPVELVTTEALSPFIGPRIMAEAEDIVYLA
jgi:uncharacterized protein